MPVLPVCIHAATTDERKHTQEELDILWEEAAIFHFNALSMFAFVNDRKKLISNPGLGRHLWKNRDPGDYIFFVHYTWFDNTKDIPETKTKIVGEFLLNVDLSGSQDAGVYQRAFLRDEVEDINSSLDAFLYYIKRWLIQKDYDLQIDNGEIISYSESYSDCADYIENRIKNSVKYAINSVERSPSYRHSSHEYYIGFEEFKILKK